MRNRDLPTADRGIETDLPGGLVALALADGDDDGSRRCGDVINVGGAVATEVGLVLSAASPARKAMPPGWSPGEGLGHRFSVIA